jgi:hypothetical protein
VDKKVQVADHSDIHKIYILTIALPQQNSNRPAA